MARRKLSVLALFVVPFVLASCAGSDGEAVPLATSTDPFFGSQYPDAHGQQDAALAIIDVADAMAEMPAGRSGDATALSADKVLDEYSGMIYTIGEAFFDGKQSSVVEGFMALFGPADPFVGKPLVSKLDLKPGDIIVSTTDARMSQMIRAFGWGHYSHAFLYVGNGMITEAVGDGVRTGTLESALKDAIRVGVMRDATLSPALAEAIVNSANAKVGAEYNWKGLAAVAYQKNLNLAIATTSGFSAMVAALTTVDSIPGEYGSNGRYFCSQLVTEAYREGGNALFTKNGASPCDIVRLAEGGRLQFVGRLPLATKEVAVKTTHRTPSGRLALAP